MKRTLFSSLAILGLIGAGLTAGPLAKAHASAEAEGGLAIVLTTQDGSPTEAASGGFDVESTTASGSGEMVLSSADCQSLEDALRSEYLLFSEPIEVKAPFAVAGVTWDAKDSLPEGSEVQMRMFDHGSWTGWYALETEEAPDGVQTNRAGTEYAVTGSSTGIQVRITKGAGELPSGLSINISYSDDDVARTDDDPQLAQVLPEADTLVQEAVGSSESADSLDAGQSAVADSAPGLPEIADGQEADRAAGSELELAAADKASSSLLSANAGIQPRSAWGANESIMTWWYTPASRNYAPFEGVIVHHTAGSNTYTQSQVPSIISAIYYYHARTNGWGDIGYNVLVDKFGGRWEGRYATLSSPAGQMVIGGHAKPRNTGTMGVSVLGDYVDGLTPSETVLNAFAEVSAWQFLKSGVNPKTASPLLFPDTVSSSSAYYGKAGTPMPRIVGHLDVNYTSCPANIYPLLWKIRQKTYDLYDAGNSDNWLFRDVPDNYLFHDDIEWMVKRKYATGWPDNTFRPHDPVTREAFIRFIYRMAGEPAVSLPAKSPFKDVSASDPYYKAVVWAYRKGLVKGYSDGTFRPQSSIHRDAVASFLYRYAGSPSYTSTVSFNDIMNSEHRKAILWLASKGIATGWSDGSFRPSANTARDAAAAFLHRYATR